MFSLLTSKDLGGLHWEWIAFSFGGGCQFEEGAWGRALAEAQASTPRCAVGWGWGQLGWLFFLSGFPQLVVRLLLKSSPSWLEMQVTGVVLFLSVQRSQREKNSNNPVFL